jgi:PAS domain S-box-containing protein
MLDGLDINNWSTNLEGVLIKITDGSPVATFVINNNHKVIHWNTAIESLTGIKKEEIIGTGDHWKAFYGSNKHTMADLIVDGASAAEIDERYKGKSRASQLIEGAHEAEDIFTIPPGDVKKWLRFTASPIKSTDGCIIGAIETLEDITKRKNAESALKESESNFRNVFECALDAIWVSDAEGNILTANESAALLTGYSLPELKKANLSLFIATESLPLVRDVKARLLLDQPLTRSYEIQVIRKDKVEIVCKVSTNLITHSGNKAFQSIARDFTREKRIFENLNYYLREITRAQEEERKRIARELHDSTAQNLIALMHKLENLLNDKGKLPIRQVKELWGLYENLRDVLQEVRRYSRDLRPSILDDLGLAPALEWLTGELQNNYGIESNLKVVGLDRRLPPEAELLLFRIVQESLMNVAKHARASKAQVEVELNDKRVRVTVSDNGVGFQPPEIMGNLLYTGKLGLAGMQERVQLLGGKLKIDSTPGKGTTVRVEAFI